MTIGELWVAHPIFPWIMAILSFWVGCSSILIVRIWVKIRKLEKQNVARRIKTIQKSRGIAIHKRIRRKKKCSCKLCSGKNRVRIEEPEPAAIEETEEDGYDFSLVENKDKERTGVGST